MWRARCRVYCYSRPGRTASWSCQCPDACSPPEPERNTVINIQRIDKNLECNAGSSAPECWEEQQWLLAWPQSQCAPSGEPSMTRWPHVLPPPPSDAPAAGTSTGSGPGGSLQTPYRNHRPSGHQPPDLQDSGLKSTRPLGACARQLYTGRQSKTSKGTSVVDEQIQSGPGPQELFTEAVDGLQTGQVQMHVRHVCTSCFLSGKVATLIQTIYCLFLSHHHFFPLIGPLVSTLLYLLDVCDGGLGLVPVSAGQDHSGSPLGQM